MSCRVAMLRMQEDGLIQLPPPRCQRPQGHSHPSVETDPQAPLQLPVMPCPACNYAWSAPARTPVCGMNIIHRYHYLGFKTLPGAQLRYWVSAGDRLVALLGFGAAAWQCAPRDQFIGWTHEQRQQNLHLVVNNARFLILPWVRSENLASKILGLAASQLPQDWQYRYGFRPLLLETFVEKDRFTGTCYRAANWLHVGQTQGRGKLGPSGKQSVPIKDVWLYSLGKASNAGWFGNFRTWVKRIFTFYQWCVFDNKAQSNLYQDYFALFAKTLHSDRLFYLVYKR